MCETEQKTVPVREAAGLVLGHDVTEINARTGTKGARFRRGHVITEDDIPRLLDLGKENIYVLEIAPDQMHEDEAALALAGALAGENVEFLPEPREGRINLLAGADGLLKVDADALERFNLTGAVMCASRHTNTLVAAGDTVAGTRAIPLVVERSAIGDAVAAAESAREAGGVFRVLPLEKKRTALIITGNEIFHGRIEDAFEPVIRGKIEDLGSNIVSVVKCPDDVEHIILEVTAARRNGADLIIMTGGMSVDPDDLTPLAARRAGAEISAYGSAALPGAMFMVGYFHEGTPVLGVPACGIHHPRTILDLVLPRVLAGENITDRDIARLGHGGLCLDCPDCRFPVCPFGKQG